MRDEATIESMWRIENYFYYAVDYGFGRWEVRRFLDPEARDEYQMSAVEDFTLDPDAVIRTAIARDDWRERPPRPRLLTLEGAA